MFSIFGMTFGTLPNLASFDASLSRDKLIQNGRIIVIDDENPWTSHTLVDTVIV